MPSTEREHKCESSTSSKLQIDELNSKISQMIMKVENIEKKQEEL